MFSILLSCLLLFSSPSLLCVVDTLKCSGQAGGGGERCGEEPGSTKLPSLSGFCFQCFDSFEDATFYATVSFHLLFDCLSFVRDCTAREPNWKSTKT